MRSHFRRRTLTIITAVWLSLALPTAAFAHPLGNFTVNHYAGLHVTRDAVRLDYVLDMAEIPAFQEIALFDENGNGQADSAESAGYHADKCASLKPDLRLMLNQKTLNLTLASSSVEFPAGVGGLPTMRLTCEFQASLASTSSNLQLSFANNVFSDRLGWREIVVIPDGVSIQGEYASTSPSNRLTNYPQDLLASPLDQRQTDLQIELIALPAQNQSSVNMDANAAPLADRNDAFTRLILLEELTFSTVLLALGISFVWGAMHALTPGHGKTVVGAYLVGSRGTIKHALYLGLTTTITHTLGVFALGLITLFAARYIVPEQLYPWMSLLSGLFVVGIGINLFASRYRSAGLGNWLGRLKLPRSEGTYSPVLQHAQSSTHHRYVLSSSQNRFHVHAHNHDHEHHDHHRHDHSHSHADHSHMPPGADGEPVTWRSLLALGISGGLLPCPSALVVLLGAIALNRIGFGLILVFAFSLGLAGALTAIGMMFIYAGRLFERFPSQGHVIRLLPALSALFVSAIGVGITLKALAELRLVI